MKIVASACELHEGALDTSGYGLVRVRGKLWKAHRLAWTRERGEIPEALQVLHRCDVRNCVNIDHVFLGSLAENMADRNAKGRQARLQGEVHGRHKLTDAQVREAREAYRQGESCDSLARILGVHKSTVHRAVTFRNWRHVA